MMVMVLTFRFLSSSFLANFHIDFFFFISVLCCTEVAISLDFSININFFMKPTIVIGYGELRLIQCFA